MPRSRAPSFLVSAVFAAPRPRRHRNRTTPKITCASKGIQLLRSHVIEGVPQIRHRFRLVLQSGLLDHFAENLSALNQAGDGAHKLFAPAQISVKCDNVRMLLGEAWRHARAFVCATDAITFNTRQKSFVLCYLNKSSLAGRSGALKRMIKNRIHRKEARRKNGRNVHGDQSKSRDSRDSCDKESEGHAVAAGPGSFGRGGAG